ncbi:MAG: hypothetical protein DWQ01_19820 [Planctomycetota bacterium]|nr:MAG: hypothetical protein DWQ01_19820 [Planctomycetota bacterium]
MHRYGFLLCFCLAKAPSLHAQNPIIERLSLDSLGIEGNGISNSVSLSRDQRYFVFSSQADNLVAGDNNQAEDVFLRDRILGTTTRVSLTSAGLEAQGDSQEPRISLNGQFVVFTSTAEDLVPGDTNGTWDVFVRDLSSGQTEKISLGDQGQEGTGFSFQPSISEDGRFVSFVSFADNLVPGDSNGSIDLFLHDRLLATTVRISQGLGGQDSNGNSFGRISANGDFVVLESDASNLVAGDGNGFADIFVWERSTGGMERVNLGPGGVEADGLSFKAWLSSDGNWVCFSSYAGNLTALDSNPDADCFLFDRNSGALELVNRNTRGEQGNDYAAELTCSDDGRYVAFQSDADNLADGILDQWSNVFVRDRQSGVTVLANLNDSGEYGTSSSYVTFPVIDPSGGVVCFASTASNLVANDQNDVLDIFLRDLQTGGPELQISNLAAGSSALVEVEGATPSGLVTLAYSFQGQGPTPFVGGLLNLSLPVQTVAMQADGSGLASMSVPVPLALAGQEVWAQAVDHQSLMPSSSFYALIP